MSVQVRRRREAASFLATYVGAQGELLIDTTSNRVQVHDGTTPGGWPAAGIGDLPGRNALVNGTFAVNQRAYASGATLAAGAYAHDRWKAGAGGCSYTFTQAVPDTTVTIATGSLVQIVEASSAYAATWWLTWTGAATARVWQGSASGSFSAGAPATVGGVAVNALQISGLVVGTAIGIEFQGGTLGRVQLESAVANAGPTRFDRRALGQEIALCQRYFQRWQQPPLRGSASGGTSAARLGMTLPTAMRAAPTATMNGNLPALVPGVAVTTVSSIAVNYSTTALAEFDMVLAAAIGSAGQCLLVYQTGTSSLDLNAEL